MAIYFDYNREEVYTHNSIKKYIPKLWTKLDQDFDLWDDDPDYRNYTIINPKDTNRKITNSYVLEVLNFICDNLDDTVKPYIFRRTNESIWSDIQDRSSGETIRKEDDVDNLDMDEFFDYLNDHYEALENTVIRKYDDLHAILVPIVSLELNFQRKSLNFIEIDFDPDDVTETKIIMSLRALSEIPYIDESLRKAFCVVDRDKNPERGKHVEIYPKDGGESTIVTNTFFLEVLDFILKESEGKYTILLKKK